MSDETVIVKTPISFLTRPGHLIPLDRKTSCTVNANLCGCFDIYQTARGDFTQIEKEQFLFYDTTPLDPSQFSPYWTPTRDYTSGLALEDLERLSAYYMDKIDLTKCSINLEDCFSGVTMMPYTRNTLWRCGGFIGKVSPNGELLGLPPPIFTTPIKCGYHVTFTEQYIDGHYQDVAYERFNISYSGAHEYATANDWAGDTYTISNVNNMTCDHLLNIDVTAGVLKAHDWTYQPPRYTPDRPETLQDYEKWYSLRNSKTRQYARYLTSLRQTPMVSGWNEITDQERYDRLEWFVPKVSPTITGDGNLRLYDTVWPGQCFIDSGEDTFGQLWHTYYNMPLQVGSLINPLKVFKDFGCDSFYMNAIKVPYSKRPHETDCYEQYVVPDYAYKDFWMFKPQVIFSMGASKYTSNWIYWEKWYLGDVEVMSRKRGYNGQGGNWFPW